MNHVLIDTSVWIDHFRNRNENLQGLLNQDSALIHLMVVGELACGTPPEPRAQTLNDLRQLTMASHATVQETLEFIEREQLFGLGCGLVDMTLLASTLITPNARIWTLDKRLAALAKRFGIAHEATAH